MVRLKFVPYALVALALVLGHVYLLSPRVSARAEATALDGARAAAGAARAEVLRVRSDLLAAGLALRTQPTLQTLLEAQPAEGVAVPTPEDRLRLLQGLARGGLPADQRGRLVLGLVSGEGTALLRGNPSPVKPPEGLDLRALVAAGTQGRVVQAFDAPHLFVSFSLVPASGTLLMALPLTGEGLAQAATAGGALGAALLVEGEPVVAAGSVATPDLKGLLQPLQAGSAQVVRRGAVSVLHTLQLPLWAGTQGAPLLVAARTEVLPGLESVGLVSLEPTMRSLADYQRLALVAFLGMLGLTVVWLLLLGGGEVVEVAGGAGAETHSGPVVTPGVFGNVASMPIRPAAAHAGAAQDPLPFGAPAAPPEPLAATGTDAEAPWATSRPTEVEDSGARRRAGASPFDSKPFDSAPFDSRPFDSAPFDSNAPARTGNTGPMGVPTSGWKPEESAEATRVASVPEELLRSTAPEATAPAPLAPEAAGDPDEQHFLETFKEFMATREACGEPPDALTYERFAAKLRKNREQLVQKYGCRTVRFVVYVKDGRAALKATPVKD